MFESLEGNQGMTPRPVFISLGLLLAFSSLHDCHSEESELARARAMALRIDHHLERTWAEHGVEPAPLCNDAQFLRRSGG